MEATLHTNLGDIRLELFPEQAPETVSNFVGLATGEKTWTDPRTGEQSNAPLYSGVIFHRVIPNFMIQGGDPLGTGTGGPGYTFGDEFNDHKIVKGSLAMANAGPGTNGSQFFITVTEPNWLNGKHTIFGEVVEGADIVSGISKVATDAQDRPREDIVINSVEITR